MWQLTIRNIKHRSIFSKPDIHDFVFHVKPRVCDKTYLPFRKMVTRSYIFVSNFSPYFLLPPLPPSAFRISISQVPESVADSRNAKSPGFMRSICRLSLFGSFRCLGGQQRRDASCLMAYGFEGTNFPTYGSLKIRTAISILWTYIMQRRTWQFCGRTSYNRCAKIIS